MKQRIIETAAACGRDPNAITLLAVSKKQSPRLIREAYQAGQRCFGESYLQEALEKIETLQDLDIEWHFIGSIQSNKTKLIAENFSWVHGVNRFKIADRLNEQRPENMLPLNICIEVNISNEATKSGVFLADLPELAVKISVLKRLRWRGLMAIPEPREDKAEQLAIYQEIADAQAALIAKGFALDTLSMGMTNDFEAAIEAGSTMVRVGTAIFGQRNDVL